MACISFEKEDRTMKAIFFDIDGTLVSLKTAKMAPSTKVAGEQLRQRGILHIFSCIAWLMRNFVNVFEFL